MNKLSPDYAEHYVWPNMMSEDLDDSLCFHARMHAKARALCDFGWIYSNFFKLLHCLEDLFRPSKVVWDGWPADFEKFIVDSVDWTSSPGWPFKKNYPTNKELFGFDGLHCDPLRLKMVESAVRSRWNTLKEKPEADPIYVFIKPEPHKISKRDKKSWRLISGVGIVDTLVDRILYGKWLDRLITKWSEVPSKAGWTPQMGGFIWMSKVFQNPCSIDKSAWDWTVQEWHIVLLKLFIPRMILKTTSEWLTVFNNRMKSLYHPEYVRYKPNCGCEFKQLVIGIQKSGCLGTIGFNSVWQVADHLLASDFSDDKIFALGDDTVQEMPCTGLDAYIANLRRTGAIVKEADVGFPIKFGGHEFTQTTCVPSYRDKHMFLLRHLDDKVSSETLTSYQYLYALDSDVLDLIQDVVVAKHGPEEVISEQYLREWYLGAE